jgi:hypothetical protein
VSRVWIVVALLACERPDDGVAIGWHHAAVGQRIEITVHTETTGLLLPVSSRRDQVRRYEVLGVDGGKRLPTLLGTFEARSSHGEIEVTKPDGSAPTERERKDVTVAAQAMFTTMPMQRALFTRRFHDGERYEPTEDERVALGMGNKSHVVVSLADHDRDSLTLALEADGPLEHPHDNFARGVVTGRFETTTNGRRFHVVTDTDMFDTAGAKIGHVQYDSLQITLSD